DPSVQALIYLAEGCGSLLLVPALPWSLMTTYSLRTIATITLVAGWMYGPITPPLYTIHPFSFCPPPGGMALLLLGYSVVAPLGTTPFYPLQMEYSWVQGIDLWYIRKT
ncbi:hypothetical protein G9A89_000695, partial [Geosiphon pyriformis]